MVFKIDKLQVKHQHHWVWMCILTGSKRKLYLCDVTVIMAFALSAVHWSDSEMDGPTVPMPCLGLC